LDSVDAESLNEGASVPVLVTGSLYMIGETVQALKNDYEALAFFRGMDPTTNEHR
jgi:dihydrofolate synthase/folylpolyglutamate synthase